MLTTTLPYENERGGSKTIKWGNKERLQVTATTSNTERLCYHCRLARIGRSYNCNIADVYCGLRTLLFMSWLRHCKSYENRIQFLTRVFIRIKSVFLYRTKKVKHITLKYITQNMKYWIVHTFRNVLVTVLVLFYFLRHLFAHYLNSCLWF